MAEKRRRLGANWDLINMSRKLRPLCKYYMGLFLVLLIADIMKRIINS